MKWTKKEINKNKDMTMKTKTKQKKKEKLIKELKENIINESIQEEPDRVFLDEMIEILKTLKNNEDN